MKTRIKCQHFMTGNIVAPAWVLEICSNRKWAPLGNEHGIIKYESKEKAEAAQAAFVKLSVKAVAA